MRLCKRAVEFVQIINDDGEVRLCSWQKDGGIIGKLTDNTMEEIYHSSEANLIRERHLKKDYSNCNPNSCTYVANNNVEDNCLEMDAIPKFPPALYLAYENTCNYRCVMCTIPDCLQNTNLIEHEKKLDRIDSELKKILPHVKKISANGLGELFASRHILKLLSEWEPLAPAEECSCELETNGSLFNEQNWRKIENLGKYNLSVSITVLSFKDEVYRELSGTNLPVENLINNLKFVKELRKKNIINFFELAIVYQVKNFREIPEFIDRCINEFEVDSVRLRPFEPWREVTMEDWYKDVRNEYHPLHEEFLEIMKNPCLKNPKVLDWGGGRVSGLGPEPYERTRGKYKLIEGILCNGSFETNIKRKVVNNKIVVYGMATVGRVLVNAIRNKYDIPYCIDRSMNGMEFDSIPIFDVNNLKGKDKNLTVIIALDKNENAIEDLLKKEGYEAVYSLKSLFGDD